MAAMQHHCLSCYFIVTLRLQNDPSMLDGEQEVSCNTHPFYFGCLIFFDQRALDYSITAS